jgi:hypothetical protein
MTPQQPSRLSVPGGTVDFPRQEGAAMPTTTTDPRPDVPMPAGFDAGDKWEPGRILSEDETRAWRLISSKREITDHDAHISLRGVQYSDGGLDDDVELTVDGASWDNPLNSDQARELAAALLEAAAELDRLAAK